MLSKDAIKVRLDAVFREVFDDETIDLQGDMTAADIEGWDSLAHIRLVIAVEKEFGFKFKAADIGNLAFVSDMMDLIQKSAAG